MSGTFWTQCGSVKLFVSLLYEGTIVQCWPRPASRRRSLSLTQCDGRRLTRHMIYMFLQLPRTLNIDTFSVSRFGNKGCFQQAWLAYSQTCNSPMSNSYLYQGILCYISVKWCFMRRSVQRSCTNSSAYKQKRGSLLKSWNDRFI